MGLFFGSLDDEDIPQKLYEKIESRISSLEGSIHRLHQEIQSLKYVLATKVDDKPKTSPAVDSFFRAAEKRHVERQKQLSEIIEETRRELDDNTSSGFRTHPTRDEYGNVQCGLCGRTTCAGGCFK